MDFAKTLIRILSIDYANVQYNNTNGVFLDFISKPGRVSAEWWLLTYVKYLLLSSPPLLEDGSTYFSSINQTIRRKAISFMLV